MRNTYLIITILTANTLLSFHYTQSMEQSESGLCLLAILPKPIQDEIASYLPFYNKESLDELIKRAQTLAKNPRHTIEWHNGIIKLTPIRATIPPLPHKELLTVYNKQSNQLRELYQNDSILTYKGALDHVQFSLPTTTLLTCSPDFSKILLIEHMLGKNTIIIFDAHDGKQLYNQTINCDSDCPLTHKAIALSPRGNLFALITYHYTSRSHILYLKNTDDEKQVDPVTVPLKKVNGALFNKQGTQIMVYAKNKNQKKDDCAINSSDCWLYSICSEQEDKDLSKKTLLEFFQQRGICKKIEPTSPIR